MYISSQRFRDEKIVQEKIAARDFSAFFAEIELDGEILRVVVDGHHSAEAAVRCGVEADWQPIGGEIQREAEKDGETFLAIFWNGDDWYNLYTGELVF